MTSKKPKSPQRKEIHDWPSFFKEIRRRPGMYIGSPSITALNYYIYGIRSAEWFDLIPPGKQFKGFSFDEFEEWVAKRYNPERRSTNSFHVALLSAKSEREGFYIWFSWYDAFRKKRKARS